VNKLEGGWCPFFALGDMGAELADLVAMSEVDVNFAALRFAINKKAGSDGRKHWWSGRWTA
jgi:hypothetical protein